MQKTFKEILPCATILNSTEDGEYCMKEKQLGNCDKCMKNVSV